MTEVPGGWKSQTLRDWGMQAQSGFASGAHNSEGNGVIHLRPMNVSRLGKLDFDNFKSVEDNSSRRIQKGDILFNNTNSAELVGKTALVDVDGDFAFSNHMTRLRFPAEKVLHEYMAVLLHSFWMSGYFNEICSNHVNQASVSIKRLEQVEVSLPPIDEQHKIIELLEDHLSRLDAALADVKQAKIKAAQFRRSILQAAFSGQLTSRETVSGTSLPEGWAHMSIGDMCGPVSKIDPSNLGRDSFKYVDIGSLEPSSSSLENIETIPTKDAPGRARQLLAVGDSIFATVRPYMKKVAYISQEFDGEIASTGFCVLRPIEEQLNAKYLFYFLLSDDLLDQVLPLQRGVSYPAIRDNDLRNAFIPLPPITEQQRIGGILEDYFSRMEATTKIADDMESQAVALRRSLLQAAFSGQLTKKEVVSV
jgi:type I restriction enzyme S subunit